MKNDVVEVLQGEELKDLYDNPKTNKEILFAFTPANFPSRIHNLVHNYYSWYGYESSASTSGYNCVVSRDYEEIMDQEKDLRWTYFTEPSGRFNGCITLKNIMAESMRHFPVTTALPVRLCLSGPGK